MNTQYGIRIFPSPSLSSWLFLSRKKWAAGGLTHPLAHKQIHYPSASVYDILPPPAPGEMSGVLCSALQDVNDTSRAAERSEDAVSLIISTCVCCGNTVEPPQVYIPRDDMAGDVGRDLKRDEADEVF